MVAPSIVMPVSFTVPLGSQMCCPGEAKKQAERQAAFRRASMTINIPSLTNAPPGIAPPPRAQLSTAAGGLADDIDRFAKMRDNGILDEEEFKIVKAKTLGVAAPGRVLLQA